MKAIVEMKSDIESDMKLIVQPVTPSEWNSAVVGSNPSQVNFILRIAQWPVAIESWPVFTFHFSYWLRQLPYFL